MRPLIFIALAVVLSVSLASPHLVAYSTSAHFQCRITASNPCDELHPSTVPATLFSALVRHLMASAPEEMENDIMPLDHTSAVIVPQVVVLVHSISRADAASLVRRVAEAVPSDTATSFRAMTDAAVAADGLKARHISSVEDFASVVSEASERIFTDDNPHLLAVPAPIQKDLSFFFSSLGVAAARANNNLAVIFALHQDAAEDPKDPAAEPPNLPVHDPSNPSGSNGTAADSDLLTMTEPDISSAQLSGLLVGAMFFIIFIPGFLCLWRIQTPQTFAILDSNDMKKKLQ